MGPMEQWVLSQGCHGEPGGLCVLFRCPGGVHALSPLSQFVTTGRLRSPLRRVLSRGCVHLLCRCKTKHFYGEVGKGVTAFDHVALLINVS